MKQGKHTKVDGTFKSIVYSVAGICILLGIGGFMNGYVGAPIGFIIAGIVVGWGGSHIPSKNRVEW
jgi:hypothetical protein